MTFYIQDTGIGIPEEKQALIFEEFEQVDASLSRTFGGAGLGLSISRQLIEQQGGKLWVESQSNRGSIFYFSLPKAETAAQKEIPSFPATSKTHAFSSAPLSTPYTTSPSSDRGHSKALAPEVSGNSVFRILIVDDEPINHKVLENYLKRGPYQLEFAMNGAEALKKIQANPYFDLVLLDIMIAQDVGL